MNIGLTYDLREAYRREGYDEEETAEFDELETIAAIESVLRALGHTTIRVGHLRALAARLVQGERWDLVFNLAEGLHGYGREAQVPALLEAYRIPYTLSDPLVLGWMARSPVSRCAPRRRSERPTVRNSWRTRPRTWRA